MPRKKRIKSPIGVYHVILRTVNQQQLFEEDADYWKFIYMLSDCQSKYQFEIYAYCLMGNHIHMLIDVKDAKLETIFRSFGNRFAQWYNKKYQRLGHLFQDRYYSVPLADDADLIRVICYIHKNPVKACICRYDTEYRWSSCCAYYGERNLLIDMEKITEAFHSIKSIEELQKYFQEIDEEKEFNEAFLKLHEAPERKYSASDTEADQIFREITSCKSTSEFQKLAKIPRNDMIRKLKDAGITPTQISRLTGLSRSMVYRLLK